MSFKPNTDQIDQLIRFAEALTKLETEEREVFINALDMIIHPVIDYEKKFIKVEDC